VSNNTTDSVPIANAQLVDAAITQQQQVQSQPSSVASSEATTAQVVPPTKREVILTPDQAQSASSRLPPGYVYAPATAASKEELPAKRVRKPVEKLEMVSPDPTSLRGSTKIRRSGGAAKSKKKGVAKRPHVAVAPSTPVATLTAEALGSTSALKDALAQADQDLLLIEQLQSGNLAALAQSPIGGFASPAPAPLAVPTPHTAPVHRKRPAHSQAARRQPSSDTSKRQRTSIPRRPTKVTWPSQARRIITSLLRHKHCWPFAQPVDPAKLNLPDYFDKIKRPMDIGTVAHKLDTEKYTKLEEVLDDVALVWSNCLLYNPPTHDVSIWAVELRNLFTPKLDALMAKEIEKRAREAAYELHRKSSSSRAPKTPRLTETFHPIAAAVPVDGDPKLLNVLAKMQSKMESMENELTTLRSSQDVKRHPSASRSAARGPRSTSAQSGGRGRSSRRGGARSSRGTPRARAPTPTATPVVRAQSSAYVAPMTHEEKVLLSQHIHALPTRKLGPVVGIIQEAMQLAGEDQPDEIEIDIDSLDPATLRKLEAYVRQVHHSKPKSKVEQLESRLANVNAVSSDLQNSSSTSRSSPAMNPSSSGSTRRSGGHSSDSDLDSSSDSDSSGDELSQRLRRADNFTSAISEPTPMDVASFVPTSSRGLSADLFAGQPPRLDVETEMITPGSSNSALQPPPILQTAPASNNKTEVVVQNMDSWDLSKLDAPTLSASDDLKQGKEEAGSAALSSALWSQFKDRDEQAKLKKREREEKEARLRQKLQEEEQERLRLENEEKQRLRELEEHEQRQREAALLEEQRHRDMLKESARLERQKKAQTIDLTGQMNAMANFEEFASFNNNGGLEGLEGLRLKEVADELSE